MAVKLYSEGAAEEVTGSKHFLDIDGERVMIDCGAFQGKREESDRKNREGLKNTANIEAVVLTHAHYDHCGLLPLLAKKGYNGNIYSTPATRDLASLIMMDSAHIQAKDAQYLKYRMEKRGQKFEWEPLFDEQDVIKAVSQFVTVSYKRPMYISKNIQLEFFDAGHILGSAVTHLSIDAGNGKKIRVGFAGDLGRRNKPIIKDPETIPAVDYLVMESTYGNRLHEATEDAIKKFREIIKRTIKRGGKVIIPAFAVERTQEIIYYLHLLISRGELPSIPVYVDSPMATNATSIFRVHPECYDAETNDIFIANSRNPFGFDDLHYVSSVQESKDLNKLDGPAVIISADGMCEAGRILHHLVCTVEDNKNTILIVGYMAENTLGRRIKNKQKMLRIFGDEYRLNAEVETINAFSGHADYQEIWDYISGLDLNVLKKIFLVHGEPDSQAFIKNFLHEKGIKNIQTVKYGEEYELD